MALPVASKLRLAACTGSIVAAHQRTCASMLLYVTYESAYTLLSDQLVTVACSTCN